MASLGDQLRAAVRNADVSRYKISQDTKIDQAVLSKFVQGKVWLSEDTVNRLADYLGIELILKPKKTRKRKADK